MQPNIAGGYVRSVLQYGTGKYGCRETKKRSSKGVKEEKEWKKRASLSAKSVKTEFYSNVNSIF